jgi:GNAT superfamily N-acetyltransferase
MSNPYLRLVMGEDEESTAPAGVRNPYEEMLDASTKAEDQQRALALNNAFKVNPDEEAELRQLHERGKQSVMPSAPADSAIGRLQSAFPVPPSPNLIQDKAQFKTDLTMRELMSNISSAPALKRKYTQEDFARIASDDSDKLSMVERTIKGIGGRGFMTEFPRATMADLAFRKVSGETLSLKDEGRLLDATARVNELTAEQEGRGAISYALNVVGSTLGQLITGLPAGAAGAGVGAGAGAGIGAAGAAIGGQLGPQIATPEELVTVPAATVTGALVGGRRGYAAGLAVHNFRQITGLSYLEYSAYRDINGQLMDPDIARGAALVVGALSTGAETFGDVTLSKALPGFEKLIGKGGKEVAEELLATDAGRSALSKLGRRVVETSGVEAVTEGVQAVIEILGGEAAKGIAEGEFAPITLEEAGARVGESVLQGAIGGAGVPIVTAPVTIPVEQYFINRQAAYAAMEERSAGGQLDRLQRAVEAAGQSKLVNRDRAALEEFVNEAAEGTELSNVFIAPDSFAQVAGELGVDVMELARQLGVADQMQDSALTSTPITMPVGKFIATVADTDLAAPLMEVAKLNPFLPSRAEIKAAQEAGEDQFVARAEALAAAVSQDETVRVEAQAISTRIASEMNTVGRFTGDANRVYATAATQMYVQLAQRLGISPQQAFDNYPLRVAGQRIGGQPESQVLASGRAGIVSEAQQVASQAFDEQLDNLFFETEFDYTMTAQRDDDIRDALITEYESQFDALDAINYFDAAQEAQNAFEEGRLAALDPDAPDYDAQVDAITAEGRRIFDETIEREEAAIEERRDAIQAEMDAREETEIETSEVSAREQMDAFRRQAITEAIDEFERVYGAAALLDTAYETYAEYDTRERMAVRADGQVVSLRELIAGQGETLGQTRRLRSREETLKKYGLDPKKKHTTRQVAAALEARTRAKHGNIARGDYSAEAARKIRDWVVDEVMFEVDQSKDNPEKSAVGWYSEKFQIALDRMGLAFNELVDGIEGSNLPGVQQLQSKEGARQFLTALIAVTSDGAKVKDNLRFALATYAYFRENGRLPANVGFGGERNSSMNLNLANIQALLDQYGAEGMGTYLLQKDTVSNLKKVAKTNDETFNTAYKADMQLPLAALYFGPKLGAFYANLRGDTGYLTMDRWWSRTFNRYRGTLLAKPTREGLDRFKALVTEDRQLNQPASEMTDDEALALTADYVKTYKDKKYKNGTEIEKAANTLWKAAFEKLEDQPFNASDREFMVNTTIASQKLLKRRGINLTVADIQAVLWYYEKRLYGTLGARQTADISYGDVAVEYAEGFKSGEISYQDVLGERSDDAVPGEPREESYLNQADDENISADQIVDASEDQTIGPEETFGQEAVDRAPQPRVIYEVAPDPNNTELAARWRQLTPEQRLAVSKIVAAEILPGVLRDLGASGRVLDQIGSYLDDTNPSFALALAAGDVDTVAKIFGFVLSQDSMMAISPKEFPGSFLTSALRLDIGDKTFDEVAAIYATLRAITLPDGRQPIGGQTTSDGEMTILLGAEDDADALSLLVDSALDGVYKVTIHEVYAAFPEKQEYDYASSESDPPGDAGLARQRARVSRSEASRVLVRETDRILGERRSQDTARDAGRDEQVDRGRLSSPRRLRDGTTEAVHYGRVAGLTATDPTRWGQGGAFLTREERNRIGEAPPRTYFGLNVGLPGGYAKEAGTGENAYYAYLPLDRLYDLSGDPDNLIVRAREIFQERNVASQSAWEIAIQEAGYAGLWVNNPAYGMAGIVFEPVPVSTERRPDAVPPVDETFGQTEITQHADGTQIRVAEDVGQITVSSAYGEVKAYTKGDAVVVTGSFVEEGRRGQGIGTDLYQALANLAFERGQVLISDRSVTDQAAGAWRALAQRGYTVLENYVPGEQPDQVGGGGASPMGMNPFVALPPGKEDMSYAEAVGQLLSPAMRAAQAEMAADVNEGAKRLGPPVRGIGFGAGTPNLGSDDYVESVLSGQINPTSDELYEALRVARQNDSEMANELKELAEVAFRLEGGAVTEVITDAFKNLPLANEIAQRREMGYAKLLFGDERVAIASIRRAIGEARLLGQNPEQVFNEALAAYTQRFDDPQDAAFMRKSITDLMGMGKGPPTPRYAARGRRGEYAPRLKEIRLNASADFSTFLHELGHHFLEVYDATALTLRDKEAAGETLTDGERGVLDDTRRLLAELARQTNTKVEGDVLDWWRGKAFEDRVQMHEQFARLTEAYFMDGKAPTPEMQGMFQTFKRWMLQVYASLTDLDVELNDEVRGILDRMVAAEADIKTAEENRGLNAMFATKPAFMTDDEWRGYQQLALAATQAAEDELTARSLRDMKWLSRAKAREIRKLQNEAAEQRAIVEAAVTVEVMSQPINRARTFLRKGINPDGTEVQGPHKLSIELLKVAYPDGEWKKLGYGRYGMLAKEGIDAEMAAELFGFESGDALIRALLDAEPAEATIEGETDRRMLEEFGDLVNEEAINRAADEALHNALRGRVLSAEYAALAKASGQRKMMAAAAQQIAKQVIGKQNAAKLKPQVYIAAERSAARKAEQALRRNDLVGAATAKRDQLLNFELAREAQRVLKQRNRTLDLFRQVTSAKRDTVSKTRNYDLVQVARAILAAHGMGQVRNAPIEYLDLLKRYDPRLYTSLEATLLVAVAKQKTIADLSVDEFLGLGDLIGQLWTLSREEKQIEIEGRKVELEQITTELTDRLSTLGDTERGQIAEAATDAQKNMRSFVGLLASLRRVESWARSMDGGVVGPFTKYVFRPISEAADRYRADRNRLITKFRELFVAIEPTMGGKKIAAPELAYTFKNKAELLHAILHTGNTSNKRKLLLGRQWGAERPDGTLDDSSWQKFLARMAQDGTLTKADFDFAQGVWDLLEETKPLAQATHRKVFGRYFAEITAEPVVTPFGTYAGGYVPAIYDQFFVGDAAVRAQQEQVEANDSTMFPSPASGFTKGRVEYNEVLELNLQLLPMHIDRVLKFAHLASPVRDVLRILRDKEFARGLEQVDPTAQSDMLLPWLQRASRQIVEEPSKGQAGRLADQFFRGVRNRSGMGLMFANLVNVAQQFTGFPLVLLRVKPQYVGAALARYVANPARMTKAARGASLMMVERGDNQMSAMYNAIEQIIDKKNLYGRTADWLGRHTYFMQQAVQNVMDVIVWTGGYDQALARGESEAEAARQGDAAVRETQGSVFSEDISRIETGPAWARTFTHMYSYFNMWGNLLGGEVETTMREVGLRKGAGRLMFVYMIGFLAPAITAQLVADALRGQLPEDEEDDGYLDNWLSWFFMTQAKTAIAFAPIVGQAANATIGAFTDAPYDDRVGGSPAISAIEGAARTISGKPVYDAMFEDGDKSRAVKDVLNLMTLLTGLPFQAAARPIGYAVDVAEGDIEPTSDLDYLRGLATGTASEASR